MERRRDCASRSEQLSPMSGITMVGELSELMVIYTSRPGLTFSPGAMDCCNTVPKASERTNPVSLTSTCNPRRSIFR